MALAWYSLGARSMLDARSFMISTLRSQVGFAAAVAHARLRLSRLELIGGSGRSTGRSARYASAARAFISPTAFEQALWERVEAGSLGAASSESAAGSGRLSRSAPGLRLLSRPRFRPSRVVLVRVCRWVWMVVRFVCVIRVPVCARVSRACPVCVPAPPGVFLPVRENSLPCILSGQ